MIKASNIYKSFGVDYIFEDISFVINPNDKVAIVGQNGVGKTTLLNCIVDHENFLNSGEVLIKGSYAIVNQVAFDNLNLTVYEEFLNIFPKIKKLKEELESEEVKSNPELYVEKEDLYNQLGGYDFKNKINKFMTGFSFKKEDINKRIIDFSGGEKTKLSLIKILLLNPDFLFLDEPTNHLDINAIRWLESYLKSLKKGIILVSHDKTFINNVCNKIFELENKNLTVYNTNYDNYLSQKELNYNFKLSEYKKQQQIIKKYEEFIIKNNQTPSKIGQVNDRKKKLEQLKKINKPIKINNKIDFKFEGYNKKKSTYIDFFDICLGYEDKTLIKDFNFKVYADDKIAIVGENGVGKTTLFKAILNKEYLKGKIRIPSSIKIGYFDQEQKSLKEDKNLFDLIYEKNIFDSQTQIRKYLSRFLFVKEDIYKKVKDLSGGEKVRLTLAIMALEKYDILLLDEPTNHLDIESKDTLIDALKNFPGSLLFISHDRDLIKEISNKVLELKNQKIVEHTNYESYVLNTSIKVNKEQKEKKTKIRKKTNKSINLIKLDLIEKEIFNLELEKEVEEEKLSDISILKDHNKLNDVTKKIEKLTNKLDDLYVEYEKTLNKE